MQITLLVLIVNLYIVFFYLRKYSFSRIALFSLLEEGHLNKIIK